MLTRTPEARPVPVAAVTLLFTATVVLLVPGSAVAQRASCPNDGPPYIDMAACDFDASDRRHIGDGPLELAVPEGTGMCFRPQGVPNDSDYDALDSRGPQDISCRWDITGPVARDRGWYSGTWDCYMLYQDGVPPASGMPGYEAFGDDGLVYRASCFPPPRHGTDQSGAADARELGHWRTYPSGTQPDPDAAEWDGPGELVVVPEAPDQAQPTPGLLELWVQAINSLEMWGPQPATAPPLDGTGLVNLPMWLWTEDTDRRWPDRLSVTVGTGNPWVIDAYAEPLRMEWEMGDGGTATCPEGSPGVAYQSGMDYLDPPSGACRYTYRRTSRDLPGGVYEILALTTWHVWWHVNGEFDNETTFQVGNYVTFPVDEIQVLVR